MKSEAEIKHEIVQCGRRLYDKGFVAANDGNISVRLDSGFFLITPSGLCKGDLRMTDILKVDRHGTVMEGLRKPTTEMKMHLAIYSARPDVQSVVHAHPAYATAFATAGVSLDACISPEIITTIGAVPLIPFALPSTDELAAAVAPVFNKTDAALLASHGVVTAGDSVWNAYYKLERIEHYAQIVFISQYLGGAKILDKPAVDSLNALRTIYGTAEDHHLKCVSCMDNCVGDSCCKYTFNRTGADSPTCRFQPISRTTATEVELSGLIATIISELFKA